MSYKTVFRLLRDAVASADHDAVCVLLKSVPSLPHEVAMEEGERLCMMAFCRGHAEILKAVSESSAFSKCFIPEVYNESDACLEIAKAHNARHHHKLSEDLSRNIANAVLDNDTKTLWRLLQRDEADPNAQWEGYTLCALAAKKGHAEILDILCCFGADFEASFLGGKPIEIAANDACKAVLYRYMAAAVEKKRGDLAISEARQEAPLCVQFNDACKAVLYRYMAAAVEKKRGDLTISEARQEAPLCVQLREFAPHQMRKNATCAVYGDAASGKTTLLVDLLQYNPAITMREQAPISSCIAVDYVFLFYNDSLFERKKLFEYLGAVFGTFEVFEQVMETTKREYNCVVIDNTCKSKDINDCVFWYKANCQNQVAIEKKKAKETKDNIAIAMRLISKCLKRGDRHFYVSRTGDFTWAFKFDSMTFDHAHGADWTDALISKKTAFEHLMYVLENDFDLSVTESDKSVKKAIDGIIESAGYFDITEIAHGNHPTIWGINGGIGLGQTSWKNAVLACADTGKSSQVKPPPETIESLVEQIVAKHGAICIDKKTHFPESSTWSVCASRKGVSPKAVAARTLKNALVAFAQ